MKKHEIIENASAGATSSSSVAGARGGLFGRSDMIKRKISDDSGKIPVTKLKFKNRLVPGDKHMSFKGFIKESSTEKIDFQDTVAKLKRSSSESKVDTKHTTVFALEDEDGKLVKVRVPNDQAREFEDTLNQALGDKRDTSAIEIAEILYSLHLKFNLIDVQWPSYSEDEEELTGDEKKESPEPTDGEPTDTEGDPTADDIPPPSDEGDDTKSALKQIVDLLKKDAEARSAEADAKKAEAKAKEAEYTARAAEAKIKQQEEVMDMEAFNQDKQTQHKEAKELAQLAKYRHSVAREADQEVAKIPSKQPIVSSPTTESMILDIMKNQLILKEGATFSDFMEFFGVLINEADAPNDTTDTQNMDSAVMRRLSSMDPKRRSLELSRMSRKEKTTANSPTLKNLLLQKDRIEQRIRTERDRIQQLKGAIR